MITAGDIIRVVFTWLLTNDDIAQNIFHFFVDSGTESSLTDLVDDVEDWLEAALAANYGSISDEMTLDLIDIYKYNTANEVFDLLTNGVATSVTGTSVAEMMPHGVAYMLERRTENPRSTARTYLAGVPENGVADGLITASTMPSLIDIAEGLTDDLITTSTAVLKAGTFSRATGSFNLATGTVRVPQEPAYQRRRKPGVGL